MTSRNPNVLYEVGLSHAAGRPVIMITQTMDDVPFDLKAIRCIVYSTKTPRWDQHLRNQISIALQSATQEQFQSSILPISIESDPQGTRKIINDRVRDDFISDLDIRDLPQVFLNSIGNDGILNIDGICYSAQTVVDPFGALCERLKSHGGFIGHLRLRLLLRDYERPFIIPCDVDLEPDPSYNASIEKRSDGFIDQIVDHAASLADSSQVANVTVEIKHYRFEPIFKAFIVNDGQIFWQFYPIQKFSFQGGNLWDYQGRGLRLIPVHSNKPPAGAIREWFARVWHDGFARHGRSENWQSGMRTPSGEPSASV
jgi:hypothetical protein